MTKETTMAADSEPSGTQKAFLTEQQMKSDQFFAAMEERFEKAEEKYKAFKELEAPRGYWDKKYHRHDKWAFRFGCLVGLSIVGLLLLVFKELDYLGTPKPEVLQLAVPLGADLLCVWAIRMLYRNYLSHAAARMDAEERVTMIETYLALKFNSEDKVKDEHMTLVLSALFRPAVCGLTAEAFPIGETLKALRGE